MAESSKDAHVVEIPVDCDNQHQRTVTTVSSLTRHHPLMEISESPGHLLLLKLWQREEDLCGRRIYIKEIRLDSIRSEIFQSCCFFWAFYALLFTLLYASSISSLQRYSCRKWWLPSFLCVFTSSVMIFLVQVKLCRYWKVWKQLQREKSDGRALSRCIQELRMKGGSFDLSKEPQRGRRMKSSSVEIKWKPLAWCSQNLVTIFLVCFTGIAFPACKFILCA